MLWIIPLFLILSFTYSASETSLFSLPRYRIKKGSIIDNLMKHPWKVIVTTIIANITANVALSSFSEDLIGSYIGITMASLVVTALILIFGEYMPKRVSMTRQKKIAKILSPVVLITQYLLYPVLLIFKPLSKISNFRNKFTSGDLREVISKGRKEGVISTQEYHLLSKLTHLNETSVREIMVPRIDVFFVEENETVKGLLNRMDGWFKRIPVYRDSRDNIVGILETKNLYDKEGKIKEFMSPPIFISESIQVLELLNIFRDTAHKMVVIINEYGGTVGVVDMEDIKRELMERSSETMIREREANSWVVSGSTDIDELENIIAIPESNDYTTISGFIYTLLERIPREGEKFSYHNYQLKILDIKDNHIRKVEIKRQ